MRRHAKASSSGPIQASGRRPRRLAIVYFAVLATALLCSSAQVLAGTVSSHPLLSSIDGSTTAAGDFGSSGPLSLAVDQSAGSLYALDSSRNVIDKFDATGNPQDFSALGSSALDVAAVSGVNVGEIQDIAVDNSGGLTDGNVYALVYETGQVFVFAPSGAFLYIIHLNVYIKSTALAVDSVGNLFVSTNGQVPHIEKLQTSNSSATFLSQIPVNASALALDSSDNLYAVTSTGVEKFDPSGTLQATIDPGGLLGSPSALAVDPSTDHLYVGDFFDQRAKIVEFDATGGFVLDFGQETIHGSPASIAVDGSSHKVYVANSGFVADRDVDVFGPLGPVTVPDVTIDAPSSVSFFSANLTGSVDPAGVPTIWRFQYREQGTVNWTVVAADQEATSAGPVSAELNGLHQNTSYEVRLVAVNTNTSVSAFSSVQSFSTPEVPPPTVTSNPASQVTASSAHLSGSVNPQGFATTYRFEYSSDDTNWVTVVGSEGDAGSASAAVPVAADLTHLNSNAQYFIRLVASNKLGQKAISGEQSFTTDPAGPLVLTSPAAIPTTTTAILNARLLANGPGTTYRFEYGPDASYGNAVPSPDGDAGSSGLASTVVSEQIDGLSPQTTYHFRVITTNAQGSATGPDRTFKTLDPNPSEGLPDGRVYEKVSPSFKNGAEVKNVNVLGIGTAYYQASTSGDAITWWMPANSTTAETAGSPLQTQYLSRLTASGWTTRDISPVLYPRPNVDLGTAFTWFADDLSRGALNTSAALRPGAASDGVTADIYLRNTASENDSANGAFDLLTQHLIPAEPSSLTPHFVDASKDLRRLLFQTNVPLTTGAEKGELYEWMDGQIEYLGGVLGSGSNGGAAFPGFHPMSADGSRIFHQVGNHSQLMVFENGTDRQVASGTVELKFRAAEASSGTTAFFTDFSRQTSDATASFGGCNVAVGGQAELGCPDLYRWDADAPPGEELTDLTTGDADGGGVLGVAGLSDDATKLYFVALGRLAPGATDGAPNLYLWQQGKGLSYIARLNTQLNGAGFFVEKNIFGTQLTGNIGHEGPGFGGARVTPDGEHLLFDSSAQITPYDNAGHKEIYLYSLASDEITCISCNPRTSHSTGDSYLSFMAEHGGFALNTFQARNLSSDASRVFFDSTEALVPGDTNGKVDVYEWSDGRLHLITTGDSGRDSTFMGAGDNGNDVFFATQEPLVRSDGDDVYDLYDAKVGGIAEPTPIPGCVGDECQGVPIPPPAFDDPGTSGFVGPGNPGSSGKKSRRCPKGKHKVVTRGITRCVKQPASKHATKKHR